MKIPRTFKLLNTTFTVKLDDKTFRSFGKMGLCNIYDLVITLARDQHLDMMESTFLHEVVHAILEVMGETEKSEDEKFVNLFAGLLHQALTTAEGEVA